MTGEFHTRAKSSCNLCLKTIEGSNNNLVLFHLYYATRFTLSEKWTMRMKSVHTCMNSPKLYGFLEQGLKSVYN